MRPVGAAPAWQQDRNLDWVDELARVAARADALAPAALAAVVEVVRAFAVEDGGLARDALLMLAALGAPAAAEGRPRAAAKHLRVAAR